MDAAGTSTDSLNISRFRAHYMVSSEHPYPERLRAHLDDMVSRDLPGALSSAVSRLFPSSDNGIWFIRRLEIKVDLNVSMDSDQAAGIWAACIARTLAKAIQAGQDGQNRLYFEDRADYLSRLLVDLAHGRAWSKWYYEAFQGLRMLSVSQALRTAICNVSALGIEALSKAPRNDLNKIIQSLSVSDARKVLNTISTTAAIVSGGDEVSCLRGAWKAWERTDVGQIDSGRQWQTALHLYLSVYNEEPQLAGPILVSAARALVRLAHCIAGSSEQSCERLLTALTCGDLSDLYRAAGTTDAEVLTPFFRSPPEVVKEISTALISQYTGKSQASKTETAERRFTHFGGIFLLLPFIDSLPFENAASDWPDSDEAPAVDLLRFLILIKCFGKSRAVRIFNDPLVREITAVGSSVTLAGVVKWQAGISGAKLDGFFSGMAKWQHQTGALGGKTLALAEIAFQGSPVAVLVDCLRGVWLYARGFRSGRPERMLERLSIWLSSNCPGAAVLLSDDIFVEALNSTFPNIEVENRRGRKVLQAEGQEKAIPGIPVNMEKLPDDLSFLLFPKPFRVSRSFDLALSIAAQGVLRAFAWRLPGFAASSLPYLFTNFLDFSASLEDEPARRVVRLGRPPLNLILNITGMARKEYRLSRLDERPFALFQEG